MTDLRPAFFIGVTGHMDLRDETWGDLHSRVEKVLRFLKPKPLDAASPSFQADDKKQQELLNSLLVDLVPDDPTNKDAVDELREIYRDALQQWCGLSDTPIVLLSSLAPGADTLVAEVVLKLRDEWRQQGLGDQFSVVAPQALPYDLYAQATTFNWKGADGAIDFDSPENTRRRDEYKDLVTRIGGPENTFPVWLKRDIELQNQPGDLQQRFHSSCQQDRDSADSKGRHDRYQAAGEYIATFSHLLIAIWDQDHDSDKAAGTAAIVDARRRGMKAGLLPSTNPVQLPPGGPVLHLTTNRLKSSSTTAVPTVPQVPPVPPIRWLDPYLALDDSHGTRKLRPHAVAHSTSGPATASSGHHQTSAAAPAGPLLPHPELKSFELMCRIAKNLNDFNGEVQPPDMEAKIDEEYEKRLSQRLTTGLIDRLRNNHPEFYQKLRVTVGLRRRATGQNDEFRKTSKSILKWLFRLTIFAAAVLHLFSHWEPQIGGHHDTPSHERSASHPGHEQTPGKGIEHSQSEALNSIGDNEKTNQADALRPANVELPDTNSGVADSARNSPKGEELKADDHDETPGPATEQTIGHLLHQVRPVMGFFALLGAIWALRCYAKHKPKQYEEREHDCRSLAEGLRVQFYWNLVSVGESVPANYMQRQRSELDWIRGAIRWTSFPYECWRAWFNQMSPPEQLELLECAQHSWVRNQASWFRKRRDELSHELHFWHHLGRILALGGVLVFLVLVGWIAIATLKPDVESLTKCWLPTAVLGTIAAVLYCAGRCRQRDDAHNFSAPHSQPAIQPKHRPNQKQGFLLRVLEDHVDQFLKSEESDHGVPLSSEHHAALLRGRFLRYLHPAATVAAVVLTVCAALGLFPWFPAAENLAIILGGWCLLLGAMSVAWAEKNLLSESAYQYSTMATLFRSAEIHLEQVLAKMRANVAHFSPAASISGSQPTAGPATNATAAFDPVEFAKCLAEARELLKAVGKEALDENAEWLILHRARPLEPLMAG